MASDMQFLSNFPVKFQNESDSCLECDGRDFCQLAQWSDRFEFAIEPGTTDISVINGTFTGSLTGWTTTDWTYNSGKARITNSVDTIYQTLSTIAGRKYKITFTVSNYTGTGSLDVYLGGLYYGLGGIDHNGTYTVYITPNSSTELSFGCLAATCTLDLDDITVELVDEYCGIKLYDIETDTYSYTFLEPNLTNASIGALGFSYLWSQFGVTNERCHKLALFKSGVDGDELVTNGTFDIDATGWTLDVGWLWDNSHIRMSGNKTNKNFYQTINTTTGETYTFNVSISGVVPTLTLLVQANGITLGTVSSDGDYSYQFIATSSTTLINFNGTVSFGEVLVDDVSVKQSCVEVALSECYKLATTHECTKMLKWTNETTNGFNYPYYYFYNSASSYGFQWMRVECDLRNSNYSGQSDKYIDSGGNDILYYGNSRKTKELFIGAMPEYMHDALAVGLKHKAFYIDSVRYSPQEDDYTPEWGNERLVIAESRVLVGKYNQDNVSID